ncbi:MAG: hypothetical protein VYC34_06930 [Planctomycetota bacterium]|nr:hypothetical protein [Planctomycetota bacterium]
MRPHLLAAIPLIALALLSGCAKKPITPIGPIECRYTFANLPSDEERQRVQRAIERYAIQGSVRTRSTGGDFETTFRVSSWSQLERLDPYLAFEPSGRRILNRGAPSVAMTYESAQIDASLDVVVRFRISPGAKLYYQPEGRPEEDISQYVSRSGAVAFRVKLRPGQKYLYARTELGAVEKFIRIDVFTLEVEEIPPSAYPR